MWSAAKFILRRRLWATLAILSIAVMPFGSFADEPNECVRNFAALDPLESLYKAIHRQPRDSAHLHSMSTRQGQGFVKIGYLSAEDPEFLESLANAVRAGVAHPNNHCETEPDLVRIILRRRLGHIYNAPIFNSWRRP